MGDQGGGHQDLRLFDVSFLGFQPIDAGRRAKRQNQIRSIGAGKASIQMGGSYGAYRIQSASRRGPSGETSIESAALFCSGSGGADFGYGYRADETRPFATGLCGAAVR